MARGLAGVHPAVCFLFFFGAAALTMFFAHPAYLLASLALACCYYFLLKGRAGLRFFFGMLAFCLLVGLINPLFSSRGERVLFTWLGGRPYTGEALFYGMTLGGMFLAVSLWFACYNQVMTGDKFTYLFGSRAPALSLVLCMALRFVPHFRGKARRIREGRRCIGKDPAGRRRGERMQAAVEILSALMSCALEDAALTADSMNSRGYGSGPRTRFPRYAAKARDGFLGGWLLVCLAAAAACGAIGGAGTFGAGLPPFGAAAALGLVFEGGFLAVPVILHGKEAWAWRILQSRI